MARFRKAKIRNETELTADDLLFRAMLNGEPITRDMAMAIPAVSSAVAKVTNAFAMTTFELFEEKKIDEKRTTKKLDDYRVDLINDDTGDTLDGFQFKKKLCEDYLLGIGGYAYINTAGNKIRSLHYVSNDKISFNVNSDPIFKSYSINVNGREYFDFKFLKFLRSTENGAYGTSLLKELNKAFQSAFEALKYTLKLTQTGGVKKGFLKSEKKLEDKSLEELKKAWARLYSGDSDNVIILNNGLDFKEATQTSLEMQLSQIRNNLNSEISSVFGITNDDGIFYKYTLQPVIVAFETALNRSLLLEKEKHTENGCFYFAADDRRLTRATMKERYEAYKLAEHWTTPNEIRYEEDKEEIEGLDFIPMSLGNVMFDTKTHGYYVPNTGQDTSKEVN